MASTAIEPVVAWLARFNEAAALPTAERLRPLFRADCYWREAVALSWELKTVSGADNVAHQLADALSTCQARDFAIDPDRCPPRVVERAGASVIEAILRFETSVGRCAGVVRLRLDSPTAAWTIHTTLQDIRGYEEAVLRARREEPVFERDFHGPNWLERRAERAMYRDRDPAVLVVGGGHAGLSVAARLGQLDVDTLVVDRMKRIGDNWRLRYRALRLHNTLHSNHLPYLPFPPTWQGYLPKDRVANWLETYADCMDIAFWTQTSFEGARWIAAERHWEAVVRRGDGSTRALRPRHIVMATSVSGTPKRPTVPTLERFEGEVIHTSEFSEGSAWAGRRVLILGTGTSAHDVAQDLHGHGAIVTLVQRSPTLVIQVEPSAQLYDALFQGDGPSLEDRDLILTSIPKPLMLATHRLLTKQAEQMDAPLLRGLEAAGFRLSSGVDGTGWPYLFRTRGGGYYFNVGCSDLIVRREVGVVQYDDLDGFVADGARLKDGSVLAADLVVLATGFEGHEHTVRRLFGEAVAERVGQIWGFHPLSQELANMWTRTPQRGLWFTGGAFSLCRAHSRHLALQIKGAELGLSN
ncbi:MAG: flavin-containing monooxygenase [Lautropia sp.]